MISPSMSPVAAAATYDAIAASGARFAPACLGPADGFAVVGDQIITAAAAQADRPARKIATAQIPGLRWNEAVFLYTPFDLALPILGEQARRRYARVRLAMVVVVSSFCWAIPRG